MSEQHRGFPQTAGATGVLPPAQQAAPPAPFDLLTPGEPEAYRVPAAYRRPYGEVTREKRGRGYFTAFMALMCALAAYIVVFLAAGSLVIVTFIPAITALILGIMALRQKRGAPTTMLSGRTAGMAWGAIAAGALCLPLAAAMLLVNSWFMSVAEQMNCEVIHANDDDAIARCIAENSWE